MNGAIAEFRTQLPSPANKKATSAMREQGLYIGEHFNFSKLTNFEKNPSANENILQYELNELYITKNTALEPEKTQFQFC